MERANEARAGGGMLEEMRRDWEERIDVAAAYGKSFPKLTCECLFLEAQLAILLLDLTEDASRKFAEQRQ